MARAFLDQQTAVVAMRGANAPEPAMPVYEDGKPPVDLPAERSAAVVDFCHVLTNSNEFVYSD
jgi:hypothetical protein